MGFRKVAIVGAGITNFVRRAQESPKELAYEAVRKQEGIGGGDIKLLAMIGAFTGWKGVLFTVFGGSLFASVVGITVMVVRRSNGQVPIPFGPFLSGASFVYVLAGDRLLRAYWSLLQ